MDKTAQMTAFVRTVTEGSFSAAAVSKHVARLEERLGARLLSRSTRHLGLTEEGRAFHERCANILGEIEEAEQAVSDLHAAPRGTLRINATVAFVNHQVIPLIPEFRERYPEVRFDLVLTDHGLDLIEEGVDVAIRFGEPPEGSFIARKLADSRRVVCATPGYLARHGTPRVPGDLAEHNCLTLSTRPDFNVWEFGEGAAREQLRVSGVFDVNHSDALYDAVRAGIGIARLATYLVGADIQAGRLVPLLTEHLHETSSIYAVYPHRRHLSPKVRTFVDFLTGKFRPVPPWEPTLPAEADG